MNYYNYSVDLPYTNTKISFREINTQEQLLIAKANVSFSNDKESLYEYSDYVLNVILNCIKNKEDFYKINIIEYILFLIKLRITSIGPTIDFLLNSKEESKTKTKIQIDLKRYLINLYNASNYFENNENSIIIESSIEVKLNWPNINSIIVFNDIMLKEKSEYEIFNDYLYEFLEHIKINDNTIFYKNLNNDEKTKLFDKLPIVLKNKIQKNIIESFKKLMDFDLFEIEILKDYKFNIFNLNFVEHIKLFFSYDLKSLYQEIYFLSVNNLPPNYIMEISNYERKVFMSIIQEQNAKREESDSRIGQTDDAFSDAIKNLALEFGQDLSK